MIRRQAPPVRLGLMGLLSYLCLGLMLGQTSVFAQTGSLATADNAYDQYVMHPKIPLLDEQGVSVLNSGKVYSPKKTCEGSGCHDYEKIGHSYHIEFGRDEANDHYGKKRGIPHLVSPGWFGGYNCMSGNTPSMLSKKVNASANDFLDWGAPDFLKGCSSCHMGGGFAEKDRDGIRYDLKPEASILPFDGDYYSVQVAGGEHAGHGAAMAGGHYETELKRFDWKQSGVVEIDCVSCHIGLNDLKKFPASGIGKNDLSDKSQSALVHWGYLRDTSLIKNEFFREAGTAFLEFIDLKPQDPQGLQLVNFEKKNFKTTLTNGVGKDSYELALDVNGKPVVHWNPKAFDADGKVSIPMKRFTPNENCMNCHSTSNSRRGFYGFGEDAKILKDPDGIILADYKDDVHKGKSWKAPNGETRKIDNCNACHSKNYFKPTYSTPELDNDHNFPKGNSDMDVRNDLDYNPNAKSCTFCHDKSTLNPDPVLPSGHATLLQAHEELWKFNGDMTGYSKETLTKITKTHLDVLSCEACHITGLENRGKPVALMYQYKKQEDGLSKITPFNPYQGVRSTWRDRKGDKVLSRANLAAVYQDGPKDASGVVRQGIIVNPMDGSELGRVGKTGTAYDAPANYEQFMALKKAYDKLMEKRGFPGTDMQLVWGEANSYTLNHGTKPSDRAMQCAECHERKQSGAWSSLIGPNTVLGDQGDKNLVNFYKLRGNSKSWTVPDKRLLDEGHIRFDAPYLKINEQGEIIARTGDVLYATRIDPFLTIAKNSSATNVMGTLKQAKLSDVLGKIELVQDGLRQSIEQAFGHNTVFYFKNPQGNAELQNTAIVGFGGGIADAVFPQYRFTMDVYPEVPEHLVKTIESKVPGSKLTSSVFWFHAKDRENQTVTQFVKPVFVKMPYKGRATAPDGIKILASVDGSAINILDAKSILDVKPDNDGHEGYIIFATSQFSWFAILDVRK